MTTTPTTTAHTSTIQIEPTLCQHILSTGLQQPFTLSTIGQNPAYLCSVCAVDEIAAQLYNHTAQEIAASINLTLCDHDANGTNIDRKSCRACLGGLEAAMWLQWSKLLLRDKPRSARLREVLKRIRRLHGSIQTNAIETSATTAPAPAQRHPDR